MKNVLSIQSHVVFGHAGNRAATFPIERLGVNVWPLNTVQFSNHTQYKKWTGMVMPATHLLEIVSGIADIGELASCDAVLSGYMGSPEQGQAIIEIVKQVKKANPNAWYFCDPVMGHPEKGCFVPEGVSQFLCKNALPLSDFIAPNILELETLGNCKITSVSEAIAVGRKLCEQGPKMVLIKHLSRAGYQHDRFEMLLVMPNEVWHIHRPLVDYGEKQPVGVGDMTSGVFLANLLKGKNPVDAFEHTTSAVYGVMLETQKRQQYELQLVAAQKEIEAPSILFTATKVE